jgi:hypothetical protein
MPFILLFPWTEKNQQNAPSFQTLMEKDFGVALELICLASNIKKKGLWSSR